MVDTHWGFRQSLVACWRALSHAGPFDRHTQDDCARGPAFTRPKATRWLGHVWLRDQCLKLMHNQWAEAEKRLSLKSSPTISLDPTLRVRPHVNWYAKFTHP